jgi:hypothetical protein
LLRGLSKTRGGKENDRIQQNNQGGLQMTATVNGDIQRLYEQSLNYSQVAKHIQDHTIHELQFYPVHDKRRETKEYKAVHERLTKTLDLPCLVCGVRNSTLKSEAENPFNAKQMETHHHVLEWALQNAIDVDKFNKILLPHLAHRHPKKEQYQKPFTEDQLRAWVDHDEDNLWVLCDVHHRAKFLGIHEITYPIWSPFNLLRPDFLDWANQEIERIKKEK